MDTRSARQEPHIVIEPTDRLFNLNGKELLQSRFLIKLLIRRDFVAQYKQSILGPAWYIISPLLSTLVYTVIFGFILGVKTDGAPHVLFFLSGVVLWTFLSGSFQKTAMMFIENRHLFSKIYFPRLAVSVASVSMRGITLAVQMALFLIILAFYAATGAEVRLTGLAFLFPVLILQLAVLAIGAGLFIAAVTSKYRDISYLIVFFTQLWMYTSPIVYPMSQVPENWRWLPALNPVAPVVELFRSGFLGVGSPSWGFWILSLLTTGLIFLVGAVSFSKVERTFVDTV